jgi:hypothetical protein
VNLFGAIIFVILSNKPTSNMKLTYTFISIFSIVIFSQCGGANSNESELVINEKTTADTTKTENVEISSADFVMEYNNNDEMPQTLISVSINGVKHEVKSISGMADSFNVEQYEEMEIPSNALAACGGWWAGAGDYFYMINKGNVLEVFHGWQDEMQEDAGYHWELLKEIELTSN